MSTLTTACLGVTGVRLGSADGGMLTVEIVPPPRSEERSGVVHGSGLGAPEPVVARRFRLHGWVVPVSGPARAVEVHRDGRLVASTHVELERKGVAERFPTLAHARAAGFKVSLNLLAIREETELEVRAVLERPRNFSLGNVRIRREHADARPPLVSVVIPCFDQGQYLSDAIESVLAQTHEEIEIVVVNDGSSDNTSEVARRYPGVILVEQPNLGLAAARNSGLSQASGDFLVFLDADDRLVDHAIATGLTVLADHPDVPFAAGKSRNIDAGGGVPPGPTQPLVTDDHYEHLLRECFIWTPSAIVYRRKPLADIGGFNPASPTSADYVVHLKLAREHRIICHDEIVTEYRRHSSNMTRDLRRVAESELNVLRAQRKLVRTERERAALADGISRAKGVRAAARRAQAVRATRFSRRGA